MTLEAREQASQLEEEDQRDAELLQQRLAVQRREAEARRDKEHKLQEAARDVVLYLRGQPRRRRREVEKAAELVSEASRKLDHALQDLKEEQDNIKEEVEELGHPGGIAGSKQPL